ncbi:MAG: HNH endonuclease signature motif containing protein, partial [Pseudonocardiaceae bacterium]
LLVQARDRTCCFPGCRRPARRCDLDHTIPYDQGGPTVAGNLGSLCRYHHRLKTHTSWSLCQPEPGLFLWTSPTGRVHHYRAPPRTEYHLDIPPRPEPPPF